MDFSAEVGSALGLASIAGIKTLDTGMVGALLISGIVIALHNRFFDTELPEWIGVFSGSAFVYMIAFFAMIPCAIVAVLCGVTEPIEFTFLFVAPPLFLVHAALAALLSTCINLAGVVGVFSGGLIEMSSFNFIPLAASHGLEYLRVNVKDETKVADDRDFKSIGTMGISKNGQAMQVIVGLTVTQVRERFDTLLGTHN